MRNFYIRYCLLFVWRKSGWLRPIGAFILLFQLLSLNAQIVQNNYIPADSVKVLTLDEFFRAIRYFHPVAKQIDLFSDQAQAKLIKARGSFDPKLYGDYDDKQFDKKNYWRQFEGGIKLPTRLLGLEIKGGFAWNDGVFLNPENNLPSQGQATLGFSLPVLRGLFIDKARASLQQAKIFQDITDLEQQVQVNDLLYEASLIYWNWAFEYERYGVLNDAVANSLQKFNAVKSTFEAGDYAGIDTTEALIQLQNFLLMRNEVVIAYQHAQLQVSTFLWNEDELPVILDRQIVPEGMATTPMNDVNTDSLNLIIQRLNNHPAIEQYRFKLAELDVERRLKVEQFKPKLDFNYNFLTPETAFSETPTSSMDLGQNYKWGVSLGFPLFLRKERGDLQYTKIKIEQTQLKRDQKQLELANKVRAYFNEIKVLEGQIDLYEETIVNYQRMFTGEQVKFQAGESSLFLLNSREGKLIEAQQKLVGLKFKYAKAQMTLAWIQAFLR